MTEPTAGSSVAPKPGDSEAVLTMGNGLGAGPASAAPSRLDVADAVAASEEMNEADEVYAVEMAHLTAGDEVDEQLAELPPVATANDEELESEFTPEPQFEAEPDPAVEPTPEPQPEPKPEPDAEPEQQPETDLASEPEPASEQQPETDLEPELEPEAGWQAEPEPEPQPAEDLAAEATPSAERAPEPEPEPEPDREEQPETDLLPPTDSTAETTAATTAATTAGPPTSSGDVTPAGTLPTPSKPGKRDATPAPPGGKPGSPRPGGAKARRPGAPGRPGAGAPALIPEPHIEVSDPTPWGRVDDDGTVYVTTESGERVVGSWQAGAPMAGLAHYGRRYDDFVTEIALLEARIAAKSGDLKEARKHAQLLRQSIDTLPAVGDLGSAAARLEAVVTNADAAMAAAAEERNAARAEALARREALCTEAEELAQSTQWKTAGDRLKQIVDEWRTIRGLDRKTDDAMWKRFSKARDTFIRRRGSHFAEMDKERGAAREAKEALIAKAETLAASTDWAGTAAEYRTLMAEWKAVGRTNRDVEDALWQRFRDAQEKFFANRQETFASRDAEFDANASVKEKLLAEAERIDPAKGIDAAKAALRSILERWESAGKVPRERIRALDGRLRAVEDRIKAAEDSHWKRSDPEAAARLAQFRTRYEGYQAQADKARAAGDAKRAATAQAQANQWLEWLRAAESAVD
jgi:Domain of Unknown Function (DUF349)